MSHATITSAGLQDQVNVMCQVYEAVVCMNLTLANSGEPIVYLNSEHQVYICMFPSLYGPYQCHNYICNTKVFFPSV